MNTWNDGNIRIHRSEIEKIKKAVRRQAFDDALRIMEDLVGPYKTGGDIQLAAALREERDKIIITE